MVELNKLKQNDAWIMHREEIETAQEGICNVYVLLDAYGGYCFGLEVFIESPEKKKILALIENAKNLCGTYPKQILISKKDPYLDTLKKIETILSIPIISLTPKQLKPLVNEFCLGFNKFKHNGIDELKQFSDVERAEIETFIPNTYEPCPCASGKKFKFCCQKAFKDITFAMCAAEEGDLGSAIEHMQDAESKVGRTAEIVCRYAICWSFYDEKKSNNYLEEAKKLNPNHPRLNYVLGINARQKGDFLLAVEYYEKALANYPKNDKFHLNETLNNLANVYFELGKFSDAKSAWEKALVYFPTDELTAKNLHEFIYNNNSLPEELRKKSPFITKYLLRHKISDGGYYL